jgi:hypothetical protein
MRYQNLQLSTAAHIYWYCRCFMGVYLHFSLNVFTGIHGALEKSADEEM